ncbi:sugar phosphate isomerase/epimerase family protein [Prosthecomicrobium sp. N25]|uniref:sugar phosphate isomerase/epimerase family protein n=1 Tax=Prosthecomicrobium sp. N25 TaxID=3129254 RepID=UPI00307874FB
MTKPLPVLGAALALPMIEMHRDWLFERNRDLELQDFFWAEVLDGDWHPKAQRIRQLLAGWQGRLGIHGPFWGFKIDSQDPEIRKVVTRRLLQGLEVCEAVGATQMVIHSPYTTWDYNNLDGLPNARAQVIERCHATLREVVRRAEGIGVTLVIENIEDKDPYARVALVRSFESDAVRVSIDTGHAHYAHGSTGAPPVDYYVHAAGELLSHIHVQDADGYADRHWLPGEGTIRWDAVFRAVATLDAKPRCVLEVRDPVNLQKGYAHLKELGLVE